MNYKLLLFFLKQNILFVIAIPVGTIAGFLSNGVGDAICVAVIFSILCLLCNFGAYKDNIEIYRLRNLNQ
ncbi:hypothetical protein KKH36_04005 [Patescibacteria group bacterium]|nr:hypothetical protein [Patescibacteria group bacterium]